MSIKKYGVQILVIITIVTLTSSLLTQISGVDRGTGN
jgi:hypothetical protein